MKLPVRSLLLAAALGILAPGAAFATDYASFTAGVAGSVSLADSGIPILPYSGNGTVVMTGVGAFTPGDGLTTDAHGNVIDTGAPFGAGGGGATQPTSMLAILAGNGTTSLPFTLAGLGAIQVQEAGTTILFSCPTCLAGTLSGNTSEFMTLSGSIAPGHMVVGDAYGNGIDGGAPPTGGGVTALTGDTTGTASGSTINTTTGKINGGAMPLSASYIGTNAAGQPVAAATPSVIVSKTGTSTQLPASSTVYLSTGGEQNAGSEAAVRTLAGVTGHVTQMLGTADGSATATATLALYDNGAATGITCAIPAGGQCSWSGTPVAINATDTLSVQAVTGTAANIRYTWAVTVSVP